MQWIWVVLYSKLVYIASYKSLHPVSTAPPFDESWSREAGREARASRLGIGPATGEERTVAEPCPRAPAPRTRPAAAPRRRGAVPIRRGLDGRHGGEQGGGGEVGKRVGGEVRGEAERGRDEPAERRAERHERRPHRRVHCRRELELPCTQANLHAGEAG